MALLDVSDRKLLRFALYSRVIVLLMQFAFDALIPDHDAGVFNPPTTAPGAGGAGAAVDYFLGGLRRWDAVYLLHVAEHGYTYENTLAFLPGVPAVWRLSGASGAQQLLLSAVCVNALCVCVTAVVVRRLAAVVVRDDVVAMRAARLYCVNPAAVFFAAPYTEAIYSLATFTGLLLCEQRQWKWRRLVAASACFAVGGACRSNGLVNVGFVAYAALVDVVGTSSRPGRSRPVARPLLVYAVALLASVALCCLPFVLFQLHAASLYCAGPTPPRSLPARLAAYAVQRGYRTAGEGAPPAWCARWPRFSYASVQSELWGVGALRYYEWRQLPNFLLAAPMACLCVAAAVAFVKTAGVARCVRLDLDHDAARTKKSDDVKPGDRFASQRNFIYIAHLCVLFVFAAIFMHIQVLTRFIASSSPVIYWYVATLTTATPSATPSEKRVEPAGRVSLGTPRRTTGRRRIEALLSGYGEALGWGGCGREGRLALVYFHLYLVVGVAAFSNFLPWT